MSGAYTNEPPWARNIQDPYERGYALGRNDALTYGEAREHENGNEDIFEGYVLGFNTMTRWQELRMKWLEANKRHGTSSDEAREAHEKWRVCNVKMQSLDVSLHVVEMAR